MTLRKKIVANFELEKQFYKLYLYFVNFCGYFLKKIFLVQLDKFFFSNSAYYVLHYVSYSKNITILIPIVYFLAFSILFK